MCVCLHALQGPHVHETASLTPLALRVVMPLFLGCVCVCVCVCARACAFCDCMVESCHFVVTFPSRHTFWQVCSLCDRGCMPPLCSYVTRRACFPRHALCRCVCVFVPVLVFGVLLELFGKKTMWSVCCEYEGVKKTSGSCTCAYHCQCWCFLGKKLFL